MKRCSGFLALSAVLLTTGCYHAVIETGRAPAAQTIEIPWAHSFLYGLVPPAVTDASGCANGLARVETQHSFLNGLAAGITFGLYTPMHITATCAAGGAGSAEIPFRDLAMELAAPTPPAAPVGPAAAAVR